MGTAEQSFGTSPQPRTLAVCSWVQQTMSYWLIVSHDNKLCRIVFFVTTTTKLCILETISNYGSSCRTSPDLVVHEDELEERQCSFITMMLHDPIAS